MRQVQLQEVEDHAADLIAEAESGRSITILKAGRPVAQIVPFPGSKGSEVDREAAIQRLRAIMDHGYDLRGLKIDSRDELYDRD